MHARPSTSGSQVSARDPLALVPSDSTMMIGIDVAKRRGTALWRDHIEPALRKEPSPATHIDPETDAARRAR